jgi:uncharacterized protein with ATP-grasp and redox domains
MRLQFHCLANCLTSIVLRVLEIKKIPPERQLEIIAEYNRMICEQPLDCHICIGMSEMYLLLRRCLGIEDPLEDIKRLQNAQAMELLPLAKELIARQEDKLLGALKMSCVGNMIDFAFGNSFEVAPAMSEYMNSDFALSSYPEFLEALSCARTITLACDNAGEIIFDRLLADEIIDWRKRHGIAPAKMRVIVKGSPILNDAMRQDAEAAGLHEVAEIFDTGSEYIGIFVQKISPAALELLRSSDMIISKGLANYESICQEEEFAGRIFFLFKAKCKPASDRINVPRHSLVFATDRILRHTNAALEPLNMLK